MEQNNQQGFQLRSSFKMKLIFGLSSVILLVFCLSGYISYRIHLRIFETELSKQYAIANEQALARLDLRIQDIYRISDYVVFNPYVEEIITRTGSAIPGNEFDQYKDHKELDELLSKVKLDAPQLSSLYLYDLKSHRYYMNNNLSVDVMNNEAYERIAEDLKGTDGGIVWSRRAIASSIEQSGYRNVIVAARLMKSPELVTYGVMVMIFDESVFSKFVTSLSAEGTGNVYLFGPQNQLLYTDDGQSDRFDSSFLLGMHQTDIQNVNDVPYLFSKNSSEETFFSLVSNVSLQDMQEKSRIILKVSVYSGILSIILAGILVTIISQQLLRPMKVLMRGMQKLRQGQFETRIDIRTRDELSVIGQSFNTMAENINSLIKEVYERQLNEREAELKALQAQLNPHFLYNTLDTIYWELYLKDDTETAQLVVSLSEILRFALEPVNELITLKDEMHQIRNYLHIQKARFKDDLHIAIEVEEDVEECQLIRLLLQPLVENVFLHAFRNMEQNKRIHIHAYRDDQKLMIEITDNGCGMEHESTQQLLEREAIADRDRKRERLGVRSVVRRIELVYGTPYGLEIRSKPGEGTTMKLILPFRTSETKAIE